MADLTFDFSIGGQALPITNFQMTGGAFGSVGHLTVRTTQTVLDQQQLDLFKLTSGAPGFVEVVLSVTAQTAYTAAPGGYGGGAPPGQAQATTTRIFGGEYIKTTFSFDDDTVEIQARDWAGVLVDQRRILTKIGKAAEKVFRPLAPGRVSPGGIANENQKVGDIVNSIAQEFGFNPVLHLSGGRNPTVGTLYGSNDQSFITIPQSLWNVLNQLARDTGYDVYVTPTKDLVFGEPGVGQDTLQLSFNVAPQSDQRPCRAARVEHHPRRNSTFRVLVRSYDPTSGVTTLGRATYVGGNYAGQHGLAAGMSTGSAAATADKNIEALQKGGDKLTVNQIPLYSFHVDGLSTAQADLKAESIATDIAKRELILTATIDGYPSLLPTQMIRLNGDVRPEFSSPTFYVSGYTQTFTLPTGAGRADSGWVSHITALNIPTEAIAKGNEG
jgi:hypothetical protein